MTPHPFNPAWWRAGMSGSLYDLDFRIVEGDETYPLRVMADSDVDAAILQLPAAKPDPTDGATKGAMLEVVRELHGDPLLYLAADGNGERWFVGVPEGWIDGHPELGTGPTEWDALLDAAHAAGEKR